MIPEAQKYNKEQIREMFPGKTIVVCDFPVEGIDPRLSAKEQLREGIINIDHHSELPEMERQVSSTNLAIVYVNVFGAIPGDWQVVVNHSDTDSVLSYFIARGILPPDEKFGAAAIAADHTGQPNEIADLLQAVQDRRDLAYSLDQLRLLLDGHPLDGAAQNLLEKRYADRERIKQIINGNGFKIVDDVSYAVLDEKIDGALVPALLPEAKLILLFSPMENDRSKWEVKFRAGVLAPQGFSLKKLGIEEVDEGFGGRWNAGGNKRNGGIKANPGEYAAKIAKLVEKFAADRKI